MIPYLNLPAKGLVALIEIGSDALRLTVAQLGRPGNWSVVERAENPLLVGRDVFTSGSIQRDTLYRMLTILEGYLEMLKGLGIEREQALLTATTAFREAKNHQIIIDRIRVKTGLTAYLIEGVEATHLTFTAVEHRLKPIWSRISRTNTFILEVGGGSSEVLLLHRGKIASAHTLRLGSVRFQEQIISLRSRLNLDRMLSEQLQHVVEALDEDFDLGSIKTFVAVGSDMRIAAKEVGVAMSDRYSLISRDALNAFIAQLKNKRLEDMVRDYDIPYHDAESLLPSMLIYRNFFEATSALEMIVPQATLRDGILLKVSHSRVRNNKENLLYEQVRASALGLARKYHCNEDHALHVSGLAIKLFDLLKDEHGLGESHRLLIEIAGIVHEVGKFVGQSAYHKHGEYILTNSQIFGLNPDEHKVIACIVRYQRRAHPMVSHPIFQQLRQEAKLVVMKLAALLRLVASMERGHSQKITDFSIVREDEDLSLVAYSKGELSLERASFEREKSLFEEVYGLRAHLLESTGSAQEEV